MKSLSKFMHFCSRKCIWKCRLWNGAHFVSASMWFPLWSILSIFWGLSRWHWSNHMIAPVPVKQPWRLWGNIPNESTTITYVNITKQTTPKLCTYFNSLAPGRWSSDHELVFLKLISWVDILSNTCEITLRWMWQDFIVDNSTLVQVMAWCR